MQKPNTLNNMPNFILLLNFKKLVYFGSKPYSDLGHLVVKVSRSHTDTPYSVGLLWKRDKVTVTCI